MRSNIECAVPLLVNRSQFEAWSSELSAVEVEQVLDATRQIADKELAALANAARHRNGAEIKRLAHKLRGMLANLGAQQLPTLLKEVELSAHSDNKAQTEDLPRLLAATLEEFALTNQSIGRQSR